LLILGVTFNLPSNNLIFNCGVLMAFLIDDYH
jgi:hypothetical protein